MSINSLLKGLGKAMPLILANAPVIAAVAKEVKRALKKQKKPPVEDAA